MPLIALAKPPRALSVPDQLLEQTCARRLKKIVSCVHKMHTNTTSMQVKPAAQAHIKKEKDLLFYLRFNLRRLDDLGQIVRFVLGAPEEVLRALVRVCQLFYNDRLRFRLRTRLAKSPLVRKWRRDLGLFRRAVEKTIAQCVTIRTQKLANMPARTQSFKSRQRIYLWTADFASNSSISRLRFTPRYFAACRRLCATLSPAPARLTSTEQEGRGEAGRYIPVAGQRMIALT